MKCDTPLVGATRPASGTRSPGTESAAVMIDSASAASGNAPVGRPGDAICFAKLLISNLVTGSLIGKNGGTINAIRTQTGCNVRVSSSGPQGFFPGTSDRVVILNGTKQALEQAIVFILSALKEAPQHLSGEASRVSSAELSTGSGNLELRFVVPNSTVSLIIGKGGSRINQLRESTGAKIQISSREPSGRMEAERIINVSGDFEHVRNSALMIAAIIQEDPTLRDFMHFTYPSRPAEGGIHTSPPRGATSPYTAYGLGSSPEAASGGYLVSPATGHLAAVPGVVAPNTVLDLYSEIYLQIPDDFVGSLVGRNGQHLGDIRTTSGARVSISQRGELVPGTRDRLVTVTGPIRSVHTAHILIMQRLAELQEALHRNETLQH
eukprot:Gregarina_sp_Poly_1__9944@NODE_656_length_6918_cov_257_889943_g498_i0_p4_GENE_NODE_656_length_6918_cov_257_889943_g498_i0NODE_656_length_6918_cov_257_889943_g498_i0_p4_ORF_typecomplete_len380_score47_25KH_1/PF00013_29/1_9e12KH_1/PF00013_29/2_3e15KH_1/PF00013_29/2_5e10KH_2/PF07650_17/9_2KH_2/PF07650_17/0_00013KH_2/PF07650_17/93KH_4/PF13083_6/0_08KH_4/PF13083_6/3_1KH_4/PF13083_6/10KH_5/PF13184_6/5_1KH_5/PF13184_6/0_049KH_5/PF13184_6/19SLS/PF14611_6/4_5e02SLS/PF14611_6/0_17SLS/PF14611_6/12MOEP19/PF